MTVSGLMRRFRRRKSHRHSKLLFSRSNLRVHLNLNVHVSKFALLPECKPHWAGRKIRLATAGFEPATFGASIPKVAGSNPAVARRIFQPAQCGLHSE